MITSYPVEDSRNNREEHYHLPIHKVWTQCCSVDELNGVLEHDPLVKSIEFVVNNLLDSFALEHGCTAKFEILLLREVF